MLILNAELQGGSRADIRIAAGRIEAVGKLSPFEGETVVQAGGGLLLPGLHDHHIHVAALAAAAASVRCGPPEVTDPAGLAAALGQPGTGWLRGVGYHDSVAGLPDAAMLDAIVADRPVRIQHRSGRMWFLNSVALDLLLEAGTPPEGLERRGGRPTGRLFDADAWLRAALAGTPPDLAGVGARLAACGVTGLTDMSPANDAVIARHFAAERGRGALPQRLTLAGRASLSDRPMDSALSLGPVKLHLHEADLPSPDDAAALVAQAHALGRAIAIHCASEVELVFALAALDEAGPHPGDRIEHASLAPDSAVAEIARLGLTVVSQPHFIAERGDAYARDVAPDDQPLLYRLQAFRAAGVTLAAGSDAPFGEADPWASMAAAVSRATRGGIVIGADEALTPDAALDLYLADPVDLGRCRTIVVGAPADLCLIDRPWAVARDDLASVRVRATWIEGRQVYDRVDQPPV